MLLALQHLIVKNRHEQNGADLAEHNESQMRIGDKAVAPIGARYKFSMSDWRYFQQPCAY